MIGSILGDMVWFIRTYSKDVESYISIQVDMGKLNDKEKNNKLKTKHLHLNEKQTASAKINLELFPIFLLDMYKLNGKENQINGK